MFKILHIDHIGIAVNELAAVKDLSLIHISQGIVR